MKNIFKKIALLSAAILTLSACANLLPNLSRRIRSSSEEINESFNGGNMNSDGYSSSTRYSSSSYNGGKSSSAYDYKEGDTFCLQGPRGIYQLPLDFSTSFDFRVFNERTGYSDTIIDYSFDIDSRIKTSFELFDNNTVLFVSISTPTFCISEGEVSITTQHGGVFKTYFGIVVDSNREDSNIHVNYPCNYVCPPVATSGFSISAFNKRTGQEIKFDKNNPFEITSIDESFVKVVNTQFNNSQSDLQIDIQTIASGRSQLHFRIKFSDGSIFEGVMFLTIRNDIWARINPDPAVVSDSGSSLVTIEAFEIDFKNGREIAANLDLNKINVIVYGFKYQIVEVVGNKITLLVEGNKSDYGDIYIGYWSQEGFYYEFGFGIMSQTCYESQRWIDFEIDYMRYQKECTMRIYLRGYLGNKIIKNIRITSTYKKIPGLLVNDVYAEYYEFKFTPTDYGEEELKIVITGEDGVITDTYCGFYIDQ